MGLGWYNISIRLLMADLGGGDSALDREEKQNLILEVT